MVSYRQTFLPFRLIEVGKAAVRICSFLLPCLPVAGIAFADRRHLAVEVAVDYILLLRTLPDCTLRSDSHNSFVVVVDSLNSPASPGTALQVDTRSVVDKGRP